MRTRTSPAEIQAEWTAFFDSFSDEEKVKRDGLILGQGFLTHVYDIMEARGMSRKELAAQMHTSASFLTQLFRGDRPLSDRNKALMARILGIKWEIRAVPLAKPNAMPKGVSVAAEPRARYGRKSGKAR